MRKYMNSSQIQAVSILNKGGIIIFPTDTAMGIGCRIDDEKALKRLFEIRKRPQEKAMPMLASSKSQALQYLKHPSKQTIQFMDTYWPGALTIVDTCDTTIIPSIIRAGGNTIGIRVPNHDALREIIEALGMPITGSSANFSGMNTPYTVKQLDPELRNLVDYVYEEDAKGNEASTVIDCTKEPFVILRQGGVHI